MRARTRFIDMISRYDWRSGYRVPSRVRHPTMVDRPPPGSRRDDHAEKQLRSGTLDVSISPCLVRCIDRVRIQPVQTGRPARITQPAGENRMRFMVIVKANEESEAGAVPSEELFTAMGQFNEELVKAGVLLDAAGLQPSSKGVRIKFSGQQ